MMVRKTYTVISSLAIVSVLLGSLFYYSMVQAQEVGEYDAWCDINDDGKIDMQDIATVARKFGTYGTPINKTALLLYLNATVAKLLTTLYVDDVNKRVGIGTTSPRGKIESRGRNMFGGDMQADYINAGVMACKPGGIYITGNNPTAAIYTLSSGSDYAIYNQGGGPSWFHGKVGIGPGADNPTAELDVNGNAEISDDLNVDSGTLYVNSLNNRVGIGTTSPAYKLDVEGYVQAHGYYTGDIIFQEDGQKLWRMFEKEDGVYLESLKTGKVYRFVLQEAENDRLVESNDSHPKPFGLHMNMREGVAGLVIALGLVIGLTWYRAKNGREEPDAQQTSLSQWL